MKTNRIIAFTLCLGALLPAGARHLTPEEALERAMSGKTGRMQVRAVGMESSPLLRVKAQKSPDVDALYVFNSNSGYMVVSAYDSAPALLAYSDGGALDADNIPPALSYWLEYYADQIDWGVKYGVMAAAEGENWPAIQPLVQSKWNQGSPYNQDCPKINNRATQTGCVATSMAQILNVYKQPDVCQGGSLTYTTTTNLSLTINFNEVTIDWANMLNSYGNSATTDQKNAVANLMKACGYAVKMNYNTGVSLTSNYNIAPAYWKYFGYSKYVQTLLRDYYTASDWNAMMYEELAAGRPIQYGGTTAGGDGHNFVCDGYDGNGRFHINWGWGGSSDGYFLLSALGNGGNAYNYEQGATRYIAPEGTEFPEDASPYVFYALGNFSTMGLGSDPDESKIETVDLGKTISLFSSAVYGVTYLGGSSVKGQLGILLTDKNGETTELYSNEATTQSGTNIYRKNVTLPASLANGIYTVKPIYKAEDRKTYDEIIFLEGKITSLNMKVSGGKAQLSVGEFEEDEPDEPENPENPDNPDDPDNPDNPDDPGQSGVTNIHDAANADFSLYTIDGRLVFSGNEAEGLKPGLYILVEKTSEGAFVSRKILIK